MLPGMQLQELLTNLLGGIFQLKSPDVTRYLELGSFYWPEQEICEIQKAFYEEKLAQA